MKKPAHKIKFSGLLNLNKPKDITSHDLVLQVRKITNERKIGHTGTLDPFATGVMILCLGYATKLSQTLTRKNKTYYARMKLGIRTDSYDRTGKIISTKDPTDLKPEQIIQALNKFVGEIEQTPPMFSAVKYKGERLYKLARKGIVVDRPPKLVTIFRIDLKKIEGDFVDFEAETSAGTYIRTLCDQIGEILGCGAHLSELVRLNVGEFSIEDSISTDKLKGIVENGELNKVLIPMSQIKEVSEIIC